MGKTNQLGVLADVFTSDASNNVGIGGSPSGSYKLEVTGTSNFTGVLRVSAATGFAVGSIAGYRRIEYTGTTFSMLTNADGYASLNAAASTFTGVGSLFNANNGTLSADILTIRGGGGTGNFGFKVEANNGEDIFYTDNQTYNIIANPISGKFGIGTTGPSTLLHINTTARTSGTNVNMITLSDTVTGVQTSGYGVRIVGTSNNGSAVSAIAFEADGGTNNDTAIAFYTQSTAGALTRRVTINRGGQLRITQAANGHSGDGLSLFNTANEIWNFVNGGDSNLYLGFQGNSKGVFAYTTGVYTALSDKNKKKDFEASTIGLNSILGLKPTLFRMKDEDESTEKHLGFIAQEVKEFIPQAYSESVNGEDTFIGLDYQSITATLVKAIQELSGQNQDLKSRLDKAGL